ncbi:MAG: hypothetical protein LC118_04555 [Dehalococcoidia bacterium]|nr:hypothetical protein [Dehalococcoidia bacterium]
MRSHLFLRHTDVVGLIDAFVVSAVTSLMAVRLYLFLAGYPQIGGGGLHVAHMIWGGLLMLAALITGISFVTLTARWTMAILGGAGFGLFIDEIGKFLTSDNNYFFRPAPALIYATFVALFLLSRTITRRGGFSPREQLVNAIELLKQAASGDLDEPERTRALRYLASSPESELRKQLVDIFEALDPADRPTRLARLQTWLFTRYESLASTGWFARAVALLVVAGSVATLTEVIAILLVRDHPWRSGSGANDLDLVNLVSVSPLGALEVLAAVAALALSVAALPAGAGELRSLRLQERAVFVWILVIQPFAFYEAQFFASAGMILSLPLLSLLQYVLRVETGRLANQASPMERSVSGP